MKPLSRWQVVAVILLVGCGPANGPEEVQTIVDAKVEYTNECQGCGALWTGDKRTFDSCPRCETLDVCVETAGCILALGTLNEIVRAQPENEKARKNQQEAEEKLKSHLESCQKCRQAMEGE